MRFDIKFASPWLLLGLVLCAGSVYAGEIKVGLVNKQVLVQDSLHAKQIQKKLEAKFGPRQEQIRAKEKTLRLKQEALNRDQDVLSSKEVEAKKREIGDLQQTLQSQMQALRTDIAQVEETETVAFNRIISGILNKLAKDKKLDLIIPTQVALYNTGKADYTQQVLQSMDQEYNAQIKTSK